MALILTVAFILHTLDQKMENKNKYCKDKGDENVTLSYKITYHFK